MNIDDKVKSFVSTVLDNEQKQRISLFLESHPDRHAAIFEERWRLLNEATWFFLEDDCVPIEVINEIVSFVQACWR